MNSIGYFEIQSSNPEREIDFYKNVFNWNFIREFNVPLEYYRIETPTINGGLLKRTLGIPQNKLGTNAFTCSIQVNNFDEISDKIIANGGQIEVEKFSIPSRCYQGYFKDKDNNVFGIFEVINK